MQAVFHLFLLYPRLIASKALAMKKYKKKSFNSAIIFGWLQWHCPFLHLQGIMQLHCLRGPQGPLNMHCWQYINNQACLIIQGKKDIMNLKTMSQLRKQSYTRIHRIQWGFLLSIDDNCSVRNNSWNNGCWTTLNPKFCSILLPTSPAWLLFDHHLFSSQTGSRTIYSTY